jgi:hypothetical protein
MLQGDTTAYMEYLESVDFTLRPNRPHCSHCIHFERGYCDEDDSCQHPNTMGGYGGWKRYNDRYDIARSFVYQGMNTPEHYTLGALAILCPFYQDNRTCCLGCGDRITDPVERFGTPWEDGYVCSPDCANRMLYGDGYEEFREREVQQIIAMFAAEREGYRGR